VVVIGASLALPMLHQSVCAQAHDGPTIDERFRDSDSNAREPAAPVLISPQSRSHREEPLPAGDFGPPYLGVTFDARDRAAVVQTVAPGSPAEQAGLQPDDTIETLQGRRVRSNQDVADIVARMRPGELLDIGYSRRVNVRTQAALASDPNARPRSVSYLPEQDFLRPRMGAQRDDMDTSRADRDRTSQNQSRNDSARRRSDDQDTNQSNDNRRVLGRIFRRR
jgi:membrane-associated protease RseP (regulator of RpoE activity)